MRSRKKGRGRGRGDKELQTPNMVVYVTPQNVKDPENAEFTDIGIRS
jgi:hypothetical protein